MAAMILSAGDTIFVILARMGANGRSRESHLVSARPDVDSSTLGVAAESVLIANLPIRDAPLS